MKITLHELHYLGVAFSESLRIQILYYVYTHNECTSSMVHEHLRILQPRASRNLKVLVECGIITQKIVGTTRLNIIRPEMMPVLEYLFSLVPKEELDPYPD